MWRMKRISKIVVAFIAAGSIVTLAGCGGKTPDNRVATNANWNVRTSANVEGDYSDLWKNNAEVATYKISFTAGGNSTYSVNYDGGSYTTKFYMQDGYDWNSADIPEAYRSADYAKETVYVYETTLSLSGEYKLTSDGSTHEFSDSVTTKTIFRLATGNLQPVYSHQDIKSTTPANLSAASIEQAYVEIDAVYETYYNHDCTEATVTTAEAGKAEVTSSLSLSDNNGFSLFENSQLGAAVRALTKATGSAYAFDVFSPQSAAKQTVQAICAGAVELDDENEEQKTIIAALDAAAPYIFYDGENGDESDLEYRYNEVTLTLAAAMAGQSNTYWYSTVENNDANAARSVLLKMVTPLSFGLGSLVYTLETLSLESLA